MKKFFFAMAIVAMSVASCDFGKSGDSNKEQDSIPTDTTVVDSLAADSANAEVAPADEVSPAEESAQAEAEK